MRHTRLAVYILLFILGLHTIPLQAKNTTLNLPAIYTSYMVIQQHKPFLLHGTANAGCKVTAQLGEEQQDAIASENGYWQVTFRPLEATHIPHPHRPPCRRSMALLRPIQHGFNATPGQARQGTHDRSFHKEPSPLRYASPRIYRCRSVGQHLPCSSQPSRLFRTHPMATHYRAYCRTVLRHRLLLWCHAMRLT